MFFKFKCHFTKHMSIKYVRSITGFGETLHAKLLILFKYVQVFCSNVVLPSLKESRNIISVVLMNFS